jgi:hypothetical protein
MRRKTGRAVLVDNEKFCLAFSHCGAREAPPECLAVLVEKFATRAIGRKAIVKRNPVHGPKFRLQLFDGFRRFCASTRQAKRTNAIFRVPARLTSPMCLQTARKRNRMRFLQQVVMRRRTRDYPSILPWQLELTLALLFLVAWLIASGIIYWIVHTRIEAIFVTLPMTGAHPDESIFRPVYAVAPLTSFALVLGLWRWARGALIGRMIAL